jgi:hypothetical protein
MDLPTRYTGPIMEVLNQRFGMRKQMRNTLYHKWEGSIPKTELTEEKEPELHAVATQLASELVAHPEVLLTDEYSEGERIRDWNALVAKDATTFDSRSRVGHKLLDHHMPHFWSVTNAKGLSVRNMMTHEALKKAILLNTQMHSTPYKSEIRRTLVLSGGLASVTKYRAGLSKHLTKRYGATSVLDPCIGWGGRMIGVLAAGADYVGCEPDPNTFRGLQGILADIDSEADITNEPAEGRLPTLPSGSVDMVLTSPPYYSLELYTAGDQSVKPQMSWETWVSEWLRPVIYECLRCLRPNGTSCWSVKNFKIGSRLYPLADVVRDIHKEKGFVLLESFTLQGPGRPGVTKPSEEQTFTYRQVGT